MFRFRKKKKMVENNLVLDDIAGDGGSEHAR